MAPLRLALAALALVAATPAGGQSVLLWRSYVEEASTRFGVPVEWIERVMRAESGGRTVLNGRPITSHAGAMGLMQIMPPTWAELRSRLGLGFDPHDPRDNIMAGTFYLRLMHDRFGFPGMFAAYNAGPARYARHLATGGPLPGETRAYLVTVAGRGAIAAPAGSSATASADRPANGIFFAVGPVSAASAGDRAAPSTLFVALAHGGPKRAGEAP